MALSYLQEAKMNAGLLASQLDLKEEKQSSLSPPLNNNTLSLFPRLQAAAPRPMALFSPEQIIATQTAALMNTRLPPGLQATLAAAANSALYNQNQMALFAGWIPPPSPPQGSISPILKQSLKRAATSPTEPQKRPRKRGPKAKEEGPLQAPPSPPNSVSPEAPKDAAPRDKVFTCGVCLRSFGYKHVLQNHERTHTGEKPFECPECHKRFTRDHHLKTHMRLHTGEKPYHCSHCDRQFVQVANLRRHLRVHTGERPYACELCSAKFSDSNQLKAHLLIHKGEKPFECENCNLRFRRRHHLVHHKCGVAASAQEIIKSTQAYARERGSVVSDDDLEDEKAPELPINLSVPMELPEQTEPEDLSMSTGSMRGNSHSYSGGDSPSSRSPSSDLHDEEDEDIEDLKPGFLDRKNFDVFRHQISNKSRNS